MSDAPDAPAAADRPGVAHAPVGRGRLARRLLPLAVIGAVVLVHFLVQLRWFELDSFNMDRVPDGWVHAQGISRAYNTLIHEGVAGVWSIVSRLNSHYTMTAHLPLALAGALLEFDNVVFRSANVLYLIILLWSVFAIGRRCHGQRAGLLAAALVSLTPAVYGGYRTIGLDFPATCLTAPAILWLIRSNLFRDLRGAAIFGGLAGLAILAKGQAAFFIVGSAAFVLGRGIWRGRKDRDRPAALRSLLGGGIAVGVVLLVTSPWWGVNLTRMMTTMAKHVTGAEDVFLEGDPSLWGGVVVYAAAFPMLITGLMTLALLALLPVFHRRSRHRWIILIWLILPVVIHVLLVARNQRYLMPLAPAAALIVSVGLCSLRRATVRRAATAAVGLGAVALWLTCSFTPPEPRGYIGPIPHRSLTALQGSSSLPSQLMTCGDACYAGPPTSWRTLYFSEIKTGLYRWLSSRHPGGENMIVFFKQSLVESFQVSFYLQDSLPRSRFFSVLHVNGDIKDRLCRGDRVTCYLLYEGLHPETPGARRIRRFHGQPFNTTMELWSYRPEQRPRGGSPGSPPPIPAGSPR